MPALTACNTPGCPNLIPRGQRRCPDHAKDTRPSPTRRGYGQRWQNTRAAFLRFHPACDEPGCTLPATDVDHIDGLGPGGPRGHDWTNLRGYCHAHHSQRTARDQPGGWAASNGWAG